MNAKQYAEEMFNFWTKTKEGPKHALAIAARSVEASDPKNWKDLPMGPTFATKGYGSDRWDLNTKALRKTHNFWVNVFYILKKKLG